MGIWVGLDALVKREIYGFAGNQTEFCGHSARSLVTVFTEPFGSYFHNALS
jgi:hypothetical protein